MSLPLEPAFSLLKEHFVVGWKNIHREDYVGHSHGYTCENAAVGTTNGAGPRNMQLYVLAADGTVLHCLPGFWHPEDLAHELRFAQAIHRLHKDKRSSKSKRAMYQRLHQSAIRNQPPAMAARSGWQGFDALNEKNRLKMLKTGTRDTFYYENGKPTKLKPTSVVLHERMAKRPFMSFRKFVTSLRQPFSELRQSYEESLVWGIRILIELHIPNRLVAIFVRLSETSKNIVKSNSTKREKTTHLTREANVIMLNKKVAR